MNIVDEIKESFKQGNTLHKLIYLNLGLFLAVQIVRIVFLLSTSLLMFVSPLPKSIKLYVANK